LNRLGLLAGLVATALFMGACQISPPAGTPPAQTPAADAAASAAIQTKQSQAAMTPQQALAELREGNARFVAGKPLARNFPAQVKAAASGQYPFAVVLSCLDSRQPINFLAQGIGDIFSARAV